MPTFEDLEMTVHPITPLVGHIDADTEEYEMILEQFVRIVVGCALHDSCVTKRKISEFVGVSDEALALLIWENQEERWEDMVVTGTSKSTKEGKYTDGGKSIKGTGRSRKGKGWSIKGINRFTALCKQIEASRKTKDRREFETRFLRKKQEAEEAGSSKKKKDNTTTYADDNEDVLQDVYMESIEFVGV